MKPAQASLTDFIICTAWTAERRPAVVNRALISRSVSLNRRHDRPNRDQTQTVKRGRLLSLHAFLSQLRNQISGFPVKVVPPLGEAGDHRVLVLERLQDDPHGRKSEG